MIKICDDIYIDDKNLIFQFCRAGGPGGQNVNKVSTAAELRFNLFNETLLSPYIKNRLRSIAKNRISKEGILVITSDEHRAQLKNKEAAMDRLIELIKNAAEKPKKRFKTKPTRTSKEKRISSKKKTSTNKKLRSRNTLSD